MTGLSENLLTGRPGMPCAPCVALLWYTGVLQPEFSAVLSDSRLCLVPDAAVVPPGPAAPVTVFCWLWLWPAGGENSVSRLGSLGGVNEVVPSLRWGLCPATEAKSSGTAPTRVCRAVRARRKSAREVSSRRLAEGPPVCVKYGRSDAAAAVDGVGPARPVGRKFFASVDPNANIGTVKRG